MITHFKYLKSGVGCFSEFSIVGFYQSHYRSSHLIFRNSSPHPRICCDSPVQNADLSRIIGDSLDYKAEISRFFVNQLMLEFPRSEVESAAGAAANTEICKEKQGNYKHKFLTEFCAVMFAEIITHKTIFAQNKPPVCNLTSRMVVFSCGQHARSCR